MLSSSPCLESLCSGDINYPGFKFENTPSKKLDSNLNPYSSIFNPAMHNHIRLQTSHENLNPFARIFYPKYLRTSDVASSPPFPCINAGRNNKHTSNSPSSPLPKKCYPFCRNSVPILSSKNHVSIKKKFALNPLAEPFLLPLGQNCDESFKILDDMDSEKDQLNVTQSFRPTLPTVHMILRLLIPLLKKPYLVQ